MWIPLIIAIALMQAPTAVRQERVLAFLSFFCF